MTSWYITNLKEGVELFQRRQDEIEEEESQLGERGA